MSNILGKSVNVAWLPHICHNIYRSIGKAKWQACYFEVNKPIDDIMHYNIICFSILVNGGAFYKK